MEPPIKEILTVAPQDTMVLIDLLSNSYFITKMKKRATSLGQCSLRVFGFRPGTLRNLTRKRTSRQVNILTGDIHIFVS